MGNYFSNTALPPDTENIQPFECSNEGNSNEHLSHQPPPNYEAYSNRRNPNPSLSDNQNYNFNAPQHQNRD